MSHTECQRKWQEHEGGCEATAGFFVFFNCKTNWAAVLVYCLFQRANLLIRSCRQKKEMNPTRQISNSTHRPETKKAKQSDASSQSRQKRGGKKLTRLQTSQGTEARRQPDSHETPAHRERQQAGGWPSRR